jgi:quercetin dioxygenase-like cupin family protein
MIPETLPTREDIERLEASVAHSPQVDIQTRHYFADGMYCREVFRAKDTLIVGKVHKKEHFYVVLKGEVTVVGDGKRERIKAPRIIVSQPGTKRAVYAHEDSICMTVHRTFETDLEAIEQELVEEDPNAVFLPGNVLKEKALK